MKADPDFDGIGPGPNPEPTPGECPHCGVGMETTARMNEATDNIITSFKYTCPSCDATFIDKA